MMPLVLGAASSHHLTPQEPNGRCGLPCRPAGGGDVTQDEQSPGYRDTVVAAACLGLVWLGDALIYVVLPVYPSVFGIETAMVAILLSVNRVIRIVGYGWVSPLSRRV